MNTDPAVAAKLQKAAGLHQRGQLAQAKSLYEEILSVQPRHFDALHLLGVVATQCNDHAEALSLFDRALAIDSSNAVAHFNRGTALQRMRRAAEALASYDRALELQPEFAEAHANRGLAQMELKLWDAALSSCEQAISIRPDYAEAWFNKGNVQRQLRQWEAALASYRQAIAIRDRYPEAWLNLGNLQRKMGQLDRALTSYDRLITLLPNDPVTHFHRGLVLLDLEDWHGALASFDRAIEHNAQCAQAYCNRGLALKRLGRLEAALESCDAAIALQADFAEAHSGRGTVLEELGSWEEALTSFRRAIEIDPQLVVAHSNCAHVLRELNRLDEALESADRALALQPEFAPAHLNKAVVLLLMGNYANGWQEFEWRLQNPHSRSSRARRSFAEPQWRGDTPLAGKTLLVHSEQGLGDSIQFCRYVDLLADVGARVILEVPHSLAALCMSLGGAARIVVRGAALPPFDCYCPLMSLPLACGTVLGNVPASVPYLRASVERARYWKDALGERTKPRVGLVWSSGVRPDEPELRTANARRNIPLAKFAALKDSDVELYSLQKGEPVESELARLVAGLWQGPVIRDFTGELRDFDATAALMEQLDLVISVDTATAHLAGALGKPVWILLRFDACWRWLLDRSDSPWYPTARLYRQQRPGDWDEVLQRVRSDLQRWASGAL